MMNQHPDSLDANRRDDEFPAVSPPSLKEITLVNLSISLFNHKNIATNELFDWNEFKADVISTLKLLPIKADPDLEQKVYQIGNEITKWVLYHAGKILHNRYVCYELFGAIPFLSWDQNGTIKYEETAVNLESSKLNDSVKLRLSFMYNLGYDLNKILVHEEILMELLTYWKMNKDDDILRQILSNSSEDFKKKITETKIFYEKCQRLLFDLEKQDELATLINLCCPSPEAKAEFNKKLIFSPHAIKILHKKFSNGCWREIDSSMNHYLSNSEDKKNLKKQLFELAHLNEPITFARKMFLHYIKRLGELRCIESYWQSLLLWYFEDNENIKKYKSTLPIEDIFCDLLKFAVFIEHDDLNRLSYCRFKSVLNVCFGPVNRFLMWVFVTPDQIQKYKCRRAQYCERIPMIKTLLKKKDKTYLKLVFQWFGTSTIKYNGKIITRI